MSKSIITSDKHGVNPTIVMCLYCQKPRDGEVAFLGKLPGDVEAERHSVIDFEPCTKCKAKIGDGIALIGVDNKKRPTGTLMVVKRDEFKKVMARLPDDEMDYVLKTGKVLLDNDVVVSIINNSTGGKTDGSI